MKYSKITIALPSYEEKKLRSILEYLKTGKTVLNGYTYDVSKNPATAKNDLFQVLIGNFCYKDF